MSKIENALYEIEHLSQLAEQNRWVNRLHPLVKLFVTLLYIGVVVSFSKYELLGVFSMSVYPVAMFVLGELSVKDALRRLRMILPLVCVVGLLNPLFDRSVAGYLGTVPITGGVLSMLSLMMKGILTVFASYLLIATTTIERICYALRCLHLPKLFVTQLLLISRYITLLLKESRRVTQAYELRAPGQKGVHFRAWGTLVGQMLLRTVDRAEEVYESMCLRGFDGDFYVGATLAFRLADVVFLIGWTAVIVVWRVFPVFEIVGGLLV